MVFVAVIALAVLLKIQLSISLKLKNKPEYFFLTPGSNTGVFCSSSQVLLLKGVLTAILINRLNYMDDLQEQFDDATYAFSQGDYDAAAKGFEDILLLDDNHFDARMSYSMALCRLGNLERAIEEGHKVEEMRPDDQMVHTNLSLYYVKIGNKDAAEHHGLQSKIASWKQPTNDLSSDVNEQNELQVNKPKVESFKLPGKFPDMPWRKSRNDDKEVGGENG